MKEFRDIGHDTAFIRRDIAQIRHFEQPRYAQLLFRNRQSHFRIPLVVTLV